LLYLHGQAGDYLPPAPGDAGVNILKMARAGLQQYLASALFRAKSGNERVQSPGLHFETGRDEAVVDLTVRPVAEGLGAEAGSALFLVTFKPPQKQAPMKKAVVDAEDNEDALHVLALKHELQAKDEYLRATQDAMQTANEDLRSSNEELQSTNEELQSTNEELETSKEELQSVNEELATVNTELQSKVADLSTSNNDMNNLLASTGIGTLFVDAQLRVRRFTPAVTQFINLIQTDIGRPLGHIVSNFVG